MVSELVELRGHIIDSLLLPRVLDEITSRAGAFEVEAISVGRRQEDPSYARLRVDAEHDLLLREILARVREHGGEVVGAADAVVEPAPADGVFPRGFHVTTSRP